LIFHSPIVICRKGFKLLNDNRVKNTILSTKTPNFKNIYDRSWSIHNKLTNQYNKIYFVKFMQVGICKIELQDKIVVFQMFISGSRIEGKGLEIFDTLSNQMII